jgi:tetratricopeptide (TPR) repeat protein
LEKIRDQETGPESKTQVVERISICLRSGDYSRALELLRGTAAEFPSDAELSELEKLAQDGVRRNAEATRLITESQELFAQRKAAEAIQLLREAHELDKNNALARAILANALVEQAHSMVETDWREAETLAKQALDLNPSHPTAKTIRGLILDQKKRSPVEEWVAQARKLQSSGDLFAALSRVEEGLDIYPNDPKLLQIQDAIQRDQSLRRRQARRRDLEDLRRMELEIDGAADDAAKKTLADRIQRVAANYWTDGEIISVANGLLQRLGLISQASSTASPHGAVIFHVPPRNAPKPSRADSSQSSPNQVPPSLLPPSLVAPSLVAPGPFAPGLVAPGNLPLGVPPSIVPPSIVAPDKVLTTPPEPQIPLRPMAGVPATQPSAPGVKVTSPSSQPKRPMRSNSATLVFVSMAAIVILVVAVILFFARRHHAAPVAKTPSSAPIVSVPAVSAPASAPTQAAPEPTLPALGASSGTAGKDAVDDRRLVFKPQPQNPQPKNVQPQSLQSQPRVASLTIQGGAPGTTVLVDQTLVGTIQPDGTFSVSTVNPGDHTVELHKERFKPRQFNKYFAAGGTISLVTADAALEAAPEAVLGELKITFAPADATVAIVKGDLLKMVSSGIPLNLAAGTYTLTARTAAARTAAGPTAERFTRSSTVEVLAGQSKTLDLSLAPSGMSKWEDPGAWKQEGDFFIRKGGDFVLYGVVPASGTFVFSAMLTKGHLLQWVLNYSDPKNYVLFQMDDNNFYRTVIHNGEKRDEIIVPDKGDKKSFRTLQIRVGPTEIVHQVKQGNSWIVLDRWTPTGANLSLGKFGFYIPGNNQVALSGFAHYVDLNIR